MALRTVGMRAAVCWTMVFMPPCVNAASGREDARVRSHSHRIIGAIAEARRRSHTFRALSDRLDRADLIIYLEPGRCAGTHVLSCLSITSGANAQRFLRITIDTEHSRAVIIQQIAHELQHAIEVAGVPQVVDADSLRALYSRIGSAEMAPDTFETIAALAVAAAVWSEVK